MYKICKNKKQIKQNMNKIFTKYNIFKLFGHFLAAYKTENNYDNINSKIIYT